MRGEGREETLEGGDAQVQAGVVGRIGDAEGRGDLGEGACPDALRIAVEFGRLQPLDVAARSVQVSRAWSGLIGLALGLAELKPGGEPVGSAGILLE